MPRRKGDIAAFPCYSRRAVGDGPMVDRIRPEELLGKYDKHIDQSRPIVALSANDA
jgi:hypothetical protein